MNEYARATGRDPISPPSSELPILRAPRPLGDAEKLHAMEQRRLVLKHIPELVPVIKEMVELGLIDGWRNVRKVEILKKALA